MDNVKRHRAIELGIRLSEARKKKGFTQDELAKLIGVAQQTIGKIERGVMLRPSREILMRIARKLEVSPGWLAFGTKDIDDLDKKAIEMAVNFSKAPPHVQRAIEVLLLANGEKPQNS